MAINATALLATEGLGPAWRDRQQAEWEVGPAKHKCDATIRTLRIPLGETELEIELFVDLGDVRLRICPSRQPRVEEWFRSHVAREIEPTEAAVIRRIFQLSATGHGVKRLRSS